MWKLFVLFMMFGIVALPMNAQSGFNSLTVNAEVPFPIVQDLGFGFSLKGAYGVGKSAQLTLSAGFSRFTSRTSFDLIKRTTRLVPLLVGYKQNIKKFFIEPKFGLGEFGRKVSDEGAPANIVYYRRPSVAALFGGVGAGFKIQRLNFGLNFLTVHAIQSG